MAKQARAMSADQVSEKTLELTKVFGSYVFDHPDFVDKLPDRATLVLLDPDDRWFNEEAKTNAARNQRLTRQSGEEPGPLVYIMVKMVQETVIVPKLEMVPSVT